MKLGKLQTKWVEYLEQHPEEQTTKKLGRKIDGELKMCCLGALGYKVGNSLFYDGGRQWLVNKSAPNDYTTLFEYTLYGLFTNSGCFIDLETWIIEGKPYRSLAEANDNGATWPEIAKFIRENPEKVFNKSV